MKNKVIFLLLSVICLSSNCVKKDSENCHYSIKFSNNTTKSLRVKEEFLSKHHPDPFNLTRLAYAAQGEDHKVYSGDQDNRSAMGGRSCYEDAPTLDGFTDTVFVYVFDAELIENTPWDIVVKDYLVLKRYDLSLDDLRRLDWRVTYPPTDAMKDIKQFPAYGSE